MTREVVLRLKKRTSQKKWAKKRAVKAVEDPERVDVGSQTDSIHLLDCKVSPILKKVHSSSSFSNEAMSCKRSDKIGNNTSNSNPSNSRIFQVCEKEALRHQVAIKRAELAKMEVDLLVRDAPSSPLPTTSRNTTVFRTPDQEIISSR